MFFERNPSASSLRIFDYNAFVKLPDEVRLKMDKKTKKCKMIRSSETGYRIWLQEEKKIVCFRNVELSENENSKKHMVTVEPVLEESESEDHEIDDNEFVEVEEIIESDSSSNEKRVEPYKQERKQPARLKDYELYVLMARSSEIPENYKVAVISRDAEK